jgi:hypothetical protein
MLLRCFEEPGEMPLDQMACCRGGLDLFVAVRAGFSNEQDWERMRVVEVKN